jgi:S-adenosylmethionine hydrolase
MTLTTDFGTADVFVGVMKGVIASICPGARVIDLTHEIASQDVMSAAFQLAMASRYFGPDTVHVCVVDPGVGTSRLPVALQTDRGYFIGPDNGVFDLVIDQSPVKASVILDNARYALDNVSATFHGRDIFAPAAAHLADGVELSELGSTVTLQHRSAGNRDRQTGTIRHVDRFGNLFSDIVVDCRAASPIVVRLGESHSVPFHRTYGDVASGTALALENSFGFVEIAVRDGSALEHFGTGLGTSVVVEHAV